MLHLYWAWPLSLALRRYMSAMSRWEQPKLSYHTPAQLTVGSTYYPVVFMCLVYNLLISPLNRYWKIITRAKLPFSQLPKWWWVQQRLIWTQNWSLISRHICPLLFWRWSQQSCLAHMPTAGTAAPSKLGTWGNSSGEGRCWPWSVGFLMIPCLSGCGISSSYWSMKYSWDIFFCDSICFFFLALYLPLPHFLTHVSCPHYSGSCVLSFLFDHLCNGHCSMFLALPWPVCVLISNLSSVSLFQSLSYLQWRCCFIIHLYSS